MANKLNGGELGQPNIYGTKTKFGSEEQLQSWCFMWQWNNFPKHRGRLFCINNNSHDRISGNRNKALGVVAGTADMGLLLPYGMAFIELKMPDGVQSKEQVNFQSLCAQSSCFYIVIRSFEDFKLTYNKLMNNE